MQECFESISNTKVKKKGDLESTNLFICFIPGIPLSKTNPY